MISDVVTDSMPEIESVITGDTEPVEVSMEEDSNIMDDALLEFVPDSVTEEIIDPVSGEVTSTNELDEFKLLLLVGRDKTEDEEDGVISDAVTDGSTLDVTELMLTVLTSAELVRSMLLEDGTSVVVGVA